MEIAACVVTRTILSLSLRRVFMKIFNDKSFLMMEKALDLHMKRHTVLTSNVANSETPGYRAREVNFAGELEKIVNGEKSQELTKTNARHIDIASDESSHIVFDNSGAVGADGNNVDLDISMGKISNNAQGYNHAVSLLTMKLRLLRDLATGRGGV